MNDQQRNRIEYLVGFVLMAIILGALTLDAFVSGDGMVAYIGTWTARLDRL